MNTYAVINNMKMTCHQGFTLLELLITVSIAGILLAIGIPSFSSMMTETRISAQYNSLVSSLYHARSEAIKGAADVTVCPKNAIDGTQCGDINDWQNGWIVFTDSINVPNEATASIENQADIISVKPAIKGLNTVTSFGSTTNVVSNVAAVNYVRYLQNGSSSMTTGSIVICDITRGAADSRALNIVRTGDIRRGTVTEGSTAPRDVFNRPISPLCPEPT
ncbi:MAG: type IV fimbrial biogenesis protein FimT [Granulosicoccus sp.]|jgi:type IV fimbrial biogenesis protein FimT